VIQGIPHNVNHRVKHGAVPLNLQLPGAVNVTNVLPGQTCCIVWRVPPANYHAVRADDLVPGRNPDAFQVVRYRMRPGTTPASDQRHPDRLLRGFRVKSEVLCERKHGFKRFSFLFAPIFGPPTHKAALPFVWHAQPKLCFEASLCFRRARQEGQQEQQQLVGGGDGDGDEGAKVQ